MSAPSRAEDRRGEADIRIAILDAAGYEAELDGLAELLVDAVDSGASVNFLAGLESAEAKAWWTARTDAVRAGSIVAFVARSTDGLVGVVLLILAQTQNGAHRAEVAKLLVHRRARERGIATRLLRMAEDHALRIGRWLLVLDTWTGSPADRLYRSQGWQPTGIVPNFARLSDGTLGAATFFWKDLRPRGAER